MIIDEKERRQPRSASQCRGNVNQQRYKKATNAHGRDDAISAVSVEDAATRAHPQTSRPPGGSQRSGAAFRKANAPLSVLSASNPFMPSAVCTPCDKVMVSGIDQSASPWFSSTDFSEARFRRSEGYRPARGWRPSLDDCRERSQRQLYRSLSVGSRYQITPVIPGGGLAFHFRAKPAISLASVCNTIR